MTYAEELQRLIDQGYTIVVTGASVEHIGQHLEDYRQALMSQGTEDTTYTVPGDSEDPNKQCIILTAPDGDKVQIFRTADYAHYLWVADYPEMSIQRQLAELGLTRA